MQTSRVLAVSSFALLASEANGAEATPMSKVFDMLDDLKTKIVKDGEASAKTYKKFFDWCDDESSDKRNEISDATAKKARLEGTIKEKTSAGDVASAEIEQLAASVSKDNEELKDATAIREDEAREFATSEADLEATIDTLSRAIGVVEKGGAALAQVRSSMQSPLAALQAIVDAAAFRVADKERLLALVQARQTDDDSDSVGAPQGAGYQKKSGGVVDLLEDLRDEAEEQLSNVRKAETAAAHNFAKLKKSLTDSIAADTAGGDEAKAAKAAAAEAVANAQGELDTTVQALKEAQAGLAQAHSDCISAAADHEKSVTSRTEELHVIDEAKKILQEATGGAFVEKSYTLLQVAARSTMSTRADLARSEVVAIVKDLAKKHHSPALAQLASRIVAVVRYSTRTGADPFAKIKNLIEGLITKLQNEAAEDASEQAWCDEQMTKTSAKKAELEEDVNKLSTKIDKATSKSVSLKGEADKLMAELAELVKSQGEMDDIRSEEHAEYVEQKGVLESGLAGVRKALEVLRDYYGGSSAASLLQDAGTIGAAMRQPSPPANHAASGEAGGSIISILEVCESDFAGGLSKVEMEEADAESEYQKMTQENKMTKMAKEQDVKYKTEAATKLVKAVSDFNSDLKTEKDELGEVLKYYGEVKGRCVAQPDPYEVQKAKRDAEIQGLKEALDVLENETALVQRRKQARRGRYLRQ